MLHPLQAAFIEHDGFQCGYCTPGQICSAVGMFDEFQRRRAQRGHAGRVRVERSSSPNEELKERMSGNLCRCGAYVGICDAIRDAFAIGVTR